MKVSNNKVGLATGKLDGAKGAKAEGPQGLKKDIKAGTMKEGAKVDLSERAQMMQKAKDIASETSVDEAKVARLQKMIDEGNYSVDADKIADRLVDEHMLIPD